MAQRRACGGRTRSSWVKTRYPLPGDGRSMCAWGRASQFPALGSAPVGLGGGDRPSGGSQAAGGRQRIRTPGCDPSVPVFETGSPPMAGIFRGAASGELGPPVPKLMAGGAPGGSGATRTHKGVTPHTLSGRAPHPAGSLPCRPRRLGLQGQSTPRRFRGSAPYPPDGDGSRSRRPARWRAAVVVPSPGLEPGRSA